MPNFYSSLLVNSSLIDINSSLEIKNKMDNKPIDSVLELNAFKPILEINMNISNIIENEMNELNARIMQKTTTFDLARRGCLYRKVSRLNIDNLGIGDMMLNQFQMKDTSSLRFFLKSISLIFLWIKTLIFKKIKSLVSYNRL